MSSPSSSLSSDLNNFIVGASRRNVQNSPELTKIGICLLRNFPASRDAVLEYFAFVFHDAVNVSINQPDFDMDVNLHPTLESVSIIGPELSNMGPAWASLIAPWCIKLLIDIATDKINVSTNILQMSDPIRILLDVTTQNLTLLECEDRAKCIDTMLGCRACSWAVGLIGRAEPALVAPGALQLGAESAKAVLAQLANHPPALVHVRAALMDLFNEAIKDDNKHETIPYLLDLASKSDIVLKALTQDIENTLPDGVVSRVVALYVTHRSHSAWECVGAELVVSLLLRAHVGCLMLLLHRATQDRACLPLAEFLFQKLESECFTDKKIPLLDSAADEIDKVRNKMLNGTKLEKYSLARLLIMTCYNLPSEFVTTISFFLQKSQDDTTLALLIRIINGIVTLHVPNDSPDLVIDSEKYPNLIKTGFSFGLKEAIMSDTQVKSLVKGQIPESNLYRYCLNVITLLRWERCSTAVRGICVAMSSVAGPLADALSKNVAIASPQHMVIAHALAKVLDNIDLSGNKAPPPSVEVILKVLQATSKYFFKCLHEEEILTKMRGVQTSCRIFRKLCVNSKLGRAIALRDLLQTAMFTEESTFGGKSLINNTFRLDKEWCEDELLLYSNQKHGPITQLTQSHTSVFHAGIIGNGVNKQDNTNKHELSKLLSVNNELLMGALMSCMDGNTGLVEGATAISLLLVELISPDVMYNGLPWPDEDFTKQVSIERELYTQAVVRASVVSRSLLRRSASLRPSLCLASALLRAVAASALHRERATHDRHSNSEETKRERVILSELVETMSLGQLLPHPLCHMMELIPDLTSSELVTVLRDCLWNYTRDNVPSPALFSCDSTGLHWRDPATSKPPVAYTDTLRTIVQKKIATLGHLYPTMFLNLEKSES